MHSGRKQPRFVSRQLVEITAPGREEVRQLWTENISQGGLFVVTDDPPPLRSKIDVVLTVPDSGQIKLKAEVVHVMDKAMAAAAGMQAGIGLQFVELKDKHEKAIFGFCDRLESEFKAAATMDLMPAGASAGEILASAMAIFSGSEQNDLYAAISMKSGATDKELEVRFEKLEGLLAQSPPALKPAQKARVENAVKMLQRIKRLLLDPGRRLEYDLRSGLLRVEVLLKRPLQEQRVLREAWRTAFPDRFEDAKAKATFAAREEAKGNLPAAVALVEQALALDPFNAALRDVLKTWKSKLPK